MTGVERQIIVYSRPGCHLCEVLIDEMLPMVRGIIDIEVVDIDATEGLPADLGTRIPVVSYNGIDVCQYYLDKEAVQAIIDELKDA